MKGILFTPDMIKAIVEGRKSQTRRLEGLKEINKEPNSWESSMWEGKHTLTIDQRAFQFTHKPLLENQSNLTAAWPRYQVGEVVYLKEAWRVSEWDDEGGQFRLEYKLGGFSQWLCMTDEILKKYWQPNAIWPEDKWHSPMMQREDFARYFVKITDVRAEKINCITENDVHKEGVDSLVTFMVLWDSLNKKRGYEWTKNCWVWVLEFQKV